MLVLLCILIFIYHFGAGIYSVRGLEPEAATEWLYDIAFVCGVVWWMRAEVRRYAVAPVYCLGLLVGMGWAIIIPYHLFKTRGVRGLIPLAALIGSLLTARILAVIVFLIFSA